MRCMSYGDVRESEFLSTRKELFAAGRKVLADAIAVEGRWLAYGWNMKEVGGDGGYLDSSMKESLREDERLCQQQFSSKASGGGPPCSEEFSTASSSGRSMETEVGEDGRIVDFGMDSRKKEVNGRDSFDSRDTILLGHGKTVGGNEMATRPGGVHSRNGKSTDVDGIRSSKPDAGKSCISLLTDAWEVQETEVLKTRDNRGSGEEEGEMGRLG